ncbi:hypothetical protein OC845_004720 [Tilletia horrida]|nr:hypothetical protein OC845_004720 [Tilletia horrida]
MYSVVVDKQPPPLEGGGSGRSLPFPLLATAAGCSIFATLLSFYSIYAQLRAYYKPTLQRYTVRILVMVPIYAIASATSLFSLNSAFVVDVLRDLYEAVTLLSLFNLMIAYLGGERSILVLAHGRKPVPHPWPVRLFYPPLDVSNPHTFLAIKRGVLQYVQIKPVLAIATIATKLTGTYHEGKLGFNYYTLEQIIYNFSVFLSLYCLAMFWSCLSPDLAAFRVTPKFICIKGIIFFSFWQGLAVSIVVALGWITRIGPVADPQYLSIAITDILICLEMPFFAIGHLYAFSPRDYIERSSYYQARLPVKYAVRDSLGVYDMMSDAVDTIKGGMRHRYSELQDQHDDGDGDDKGGRGGQQKPPAVTLMGRVGAVLRTPYDVIKGWTRKRQTRRQGYSPLLQDDDSNGVDAYGSTDLEHGKKHRKPSHKPKSELYYHDSDDDDDDDEEEEDELATRLRALTKEGVIGMLDFLTGQKFVDSHNDDETVVSCHFSLHEDEDHDQDTTPSSFSSSTTSTTPPPARLDDTEEMYEEARQLAKEDVCFPGHETGEQEEQLRKWIVDQEAALRAAAHPSREEAAEEARHGLSGAAAAAATAVLPWVKRRRMREEELIRRMNTIRERKMARRDARKRNRAARRGGDEDDDDDGVESSTAVVPAESSSQSKKRRKVKDKDKGKGKGKGRTRTTEAGQDELVSRVDPGTSETPGSSGARSSGQ